MLPSSTTTEVADRAFRSCERIFTFALAALLGLGACDANSTATRSPPDAPPQADGDFSLLYRDDFDTLDSTRWQLMTHSWDSNLALFSASSAAVEDGALVIRLLPAPNGTVDGSNKPSRFWVPKCGRRHADLRTSTSAHEVRARLGGDFFPGHHLHTVARRRLERARYRVLGRHAHEHAVQRASLPRTRPRPRPSRRRYHRLPRK